MDTAPEETSGETQPENELAQSTEETGPSDDEVEEEEEEEWQGFGPTDQDWGSRWTKDEKEEGGDSPLSSPSSTSGTASSLVSSKVLDSPLHPSSSPTMVKPKGMQLLKSKNSSAKPRTGSVPKLTQSTATTVSNSTLSKEDAERLEQQSHWADIEPDLFADMTPAITSNPPKSSVPVPSLSENRHSTKTENHKKSLTPSLDYQPQETEVSTIIHISASTFGFQHCFCNYRQDGKMGGTMISDHTHQQKNAQAHLQIPFFVLCNTNHKKLSGIKFRI